MWLDYCLLKLLLLLSICISIEVQEKNHKHDEGHVFLFLIAVSLCRKLIFPICNGIKGPLQIKIIAHPSCVSNLLYKGKEFGMCISYFNLFLV